jgi:hypothetical protein
VSSSDVRLLEAVGRKAGRFDIPGVDPVGPWKLCLFPLIPDPDIDVRAARGAAEGGGGGPIGPFVLVGRALVAAAEGRGVVVPDDRPEAGVDEVLSCFVGDLDGDYIRSAKVRECYQKAL